MANNKDLTISLRPKTPDPVTEPAPSAPSFPPAPPRRPRSRSRTSTYIAYLVAIAILVGGGYAWYSWDTWFPDTDLRTTEMSEAEVQEEIQDVVESVGKLIVLPEGEDPTIATVTDPEKLRDQVFFANAKEGDIVLIYTKAQKAYLYDPDAHRLVEVAPLTIQ